MALLGHSARLLLHHEAPLQASESWELIGFEQEHASEDEVQLSDGQIFVTICRGEQHVPKLAYVAASLQSVKDKILASGNTLDIISQQELSFRGPGMLEYTVVPATADNIVHRTGDSNPVLGYLDALVVPVEDADASAVWAQKCGYFIAEATGRAIPCVDVTDGIWMLSFREQALRAPFLHYTADMDAEWVAELQEALPTADVKLGPDGHAIVVVCSMPGGIPVMITSDEIE